MAPFRKFKCLIYGQDGNRAQNEEEQIIAMPKPGPTLELQPERPHEEEPSQDGEPDLSPIENDTEPFPDFVDTWNDWNEGDEDGGMQDEYMQHCIVHCTHYICQDIAARPKDSTDTKCKCRIVSKAKEPDTPDAAARFKGQDRQYNKSPSPVGKPKIHWHGWN